MTMDFLIVDANESPDYISNVANLEFTGLTPGGQYEVTYIHGLRPVKRWLDCTTDTDGDGSLDGEPTVRIGNNYTDAVNEATVPFTASAEGKMIAELVPRIDRQEGDLAGLRLKYIPEPGTIVLILTALVACCARRRIV